VKSETQRVKPEGARTKSINMMENVSKRILRHDESLVGKPQKRPACNVIVRQCAKQINVIEVKDSMRTHLCCWLCLAAFTLCFVNAGSRPHLSRRLLNDEWGVGELEPSAGPSAQQIEPGSGQAGQLGGRGKQVSCWQP